MILATLMMDTTKALPDWRTDPKLKEPAAAVDAATKAITDAETRIDKAAALVIAIDADLASATDMKRATALEDRRDEAVASETKAKTDLDRARRALDRAQKMHGPLALAAQRDCASKMHARWQAQALDVVEKAEALKASVAKLQEVDEHVETIFPHEGSQHGLALGLAGDGAEVFNAPNPLLGLRARLVSTVLGRNFVKLDAWLTLAREWTR